KLDDPLAMYLNDLTTIPANLAGVPGIALPSGLAPEDDLPVGIQFMAPAREDARLYTVGAALEQLLVAQWGGTLLEQAPTLWAGRRPVSGGGATRPQSRAGRVRRAPRPPLSASSATPGVRLAAIRRGSPAMPLGVRRAAGGRVRR